MLTLSISIAAILITILSALILVLKRHQRFSNIALSISLLATSSVIFSDSMSIVNPDSLLEWKTVAFISEAVMVSAWLLFTLRFAKESSWNTINRFSRAMVFLSPLLMIVFIMLQVENFFYSPEFESEKVLFLDNTGYFFNIILIFYSIMSIVNLESTLRSSSGVNRRSIKYTLIGVGGIIAINIFYYSQALLYRSINMNLLPVRDGVVLISVILIAYSLIRHRAMDVEIQVSRKILFRSLSIFIVGLYLLGLGLIGEGMRYFGPKVGRNITTFLGFAGAILVLVIILSEELRRKAIVFISKNFYSQKYDYRDEWLQFTKRISFKNSIEELLSSIAEGFQRAIGVKGVTIWLKEKNNTEYECVKALEADIVEAKPFRRLIDFLRDKKWVLSVHDVNCREIVAENIEFIGSTGASLIVPLVNVDDLTGFIVLQKSLAEDIYNFEDYDLLKNLASQSTAAILNAKLSEELTEAKEMEAMGRLSSFIIHDLKNATSMLSLIAQNAEHHIDNPDFQKDAIRAISNTSKKINSIIDKLKNLPRKTSLDLEDLDLGKCVQETINEININENENLSFREMEHVNARFDNEEISKVVINLIINAFDATGSKGKIEVTVGEEYNMGFVRVSDNGCGMSPEFIEKHLFKPFQTTKKKGLGIGLYQCKTIIEAHSGKLKVNSEEGKGAEFTICLPKA